MNSYASEKYKTNIRSQITKYLHEQINAENNDSFNTNA